MEIGQVESICTVSVHVPPMVGSAHLTSALLIQWRTRLMAEILPLRKTCYFCFSFFDFCLMLVDILVYEDHEGLLCDVVKEQKRNEMTGTDRPKELKWWKWDLTVHHPRDLLLLLVYHWRSMDKKRLEVFVFSHFFLLCLPVYRCQKRASKHIQEGSAKPSSCWWDTNSYSKISSPDFFYFFYFFKVRLLHQGCTAWSCHIQSKEAENK